MGKRKDGMVIEIQEGQSTDEVAKVIRKMMVASLARFSKSELADGLAVAMANIYTLELALHDIVTRWGSMSEPERKRAIVAMAQMMSQSSGTEIIEVPGRLQ